MSVDLPSRRTATPVARGPRSAPAAACAFAPGPRSAPVLAIAFAVASILASASGCVLAPSVALPPRDSDIALGREVATRVGEQTGLYDDPALRSYVEAVGDRVLAEVDEPGFDYSFEILDQVEPNAFAAPGGFVYVSRGLLSLARSEDELAAVLAHEVVHVGRRHTAKQLAKARRPSLLALPGRVVGTVVDRQLGDLLSSPFDSFGRAVLASYSRSHETEADRIGQALAAGAGYDPGALATILERMELEEEIVTGRRRKADFFDTHPTTPARSEAIRRRAREIDPAPRAGIAASNEEFLERLDGLLLGPDPAHGVFRDSAFLHPDLDLHVDLPADWRTQNSPIAAGGFAPDGRSLGYLGIAGPGDDPKPYADAMEKLLAADHGAEPSARREHSVGPWPGYLLEYREDTRREPVRLFALWIAKDGIVLQWIGVAPEDRAAELAAIVESLRPLTPAGRDSIVEHRLRIVRARAGESLTALGRRNANVWIPARFALVNGVDADHVYAGGEPVKIAVALPYGGRRTAP